MTTSFQLESDMLRHLPTTDLEALGSPSGQMFFEVPCPSGKIPDVVLADLNESVAANRQAQSLGVIKTLTELAIVREIEFAGARGLTSVEVAACVRITQGHARSVVLPRLQEAGWLQREGDRWSATTEYRSPMSRIVTVELKLSDWKGGLGQASRHAHSSYCSWLVMDANRLAPAIENRAYFDRYGVGLAGLHTDSNEISIAIDPQPMRNADLLKSVFAERLFELHAAGERVGRHRHTFGRPTEFPPNAADA